MKLITKVAILSILVISASANDRIKNFYDNGQMKLIGTYDDNGLRQGKFKRFLNDGTIIEDTIYKNNKIKSGYKKETLNTNEIYYDLNKNDEIIELDIVPKYKLYKEYSNGKLIPNNSITFPTLPNS